MKLTPHSPKWFEALRKFNRQQADHTAKILELAGRSDVCGICGDDPASDYEIQLIAPPAGAVTTLRLCDDCHEIRAQTGERFMRL